jgi:hypothetical protein
VTLKWIEESILGFSIAAIMAFFVSAQAGDVSHAAAKDKEPDEALAVRCLHIINTAEINYAATYDKGYSRTLAPALETAAKQTDPSLGGAELIDGSLMRGKKGGYVFAYKPGVVQGGKIVTYTVVARPEKWRKGLRSLFTDETAVIRWTSENRAATAKDATIDSLPGV